MNISYFFLGMLWFVVLIGGSIDAYEYFIEKKSQESDEDFDPSRRLFLKRNFALTGVSLFATLGGVGAYQAYHPNIKKVSIRLSEKYPNLKGLKITQISDLHIGPVLGINYVKFVVEEANKLDSDLIVVTGDLMDGTPEAIGNMLDPLINLQSRLGTYYVTGNHEYYWDAPRWIEQVKKLNFNVLINESILLDYKNEKFILAGVPDTISSQFTDHHCDPGKAIENQKDKNLCKILLGHRPKICFDAEKYNYDFFLCGHTHGGQGFPWNYITYFVQPYLNGLYNHKGMWLYVNPGTGFWGPPNRLGVSGEITQFTIV